MRFFALYLVLAVCTAGAFLMSPQAVPLPLDRPIVAAADIDSDGLHQKAVDALESLLRAGERRRAEASDKL